MSNISDDGATISWTIPEDEDLIGVIVFQYKSGEDSDWKNETITPPTNSIDLTGLEPNTDYHVRLVVESQDGNDVRLSPVTDFTTQTSEQFFIDRNPNTILDY